MINKTFPIRNQCFYTINSFYGGVERRAHYFSTRNNLLKFMNKIYDSYGSLSYYPLGHTTTSYNKKLYPIKIHKHPITKVCLSEYFNHIIFDIVKDNTFNDTTILSNSEYFNHIFCATVNDDNTFNDTPLLFNKVFKLYNRKHKGYINPNKQKLNVYKKGQFWFANDLIDFILGNMGHIDEFFDVYQYSFDTIVDENLTKLANAIQKRSYNFFTNHVHKGASTNNFYYMIKRNNDGLYSDGQCVYGRPIFREKMLGQLFTKKQLDEHMTFMSILNPTCYKGCSIEKCRLKTTFEKDAEVEMEKIQFQNILHDK